MERHKKFFRKSENRRESGSNQKTLKRIIIKNKYAKIYPKKDYVVILDEGEEIIIGYRYIKEFYIHKDSSLPLRFLLKLLEKKKVFLIDGFGNILREVKIV
jgi:hypothetical protein